MTHSIRNPQQTHATFEIPQEVEYLGYWVSKSGIQPIPKKVDAINNMARPTTLKELRRFIGMFNY
jgi:hypothetical protein